MILQPVVVAELGDQARERAVVDAAHLSRAQARGEQAGRSDGCQQLGDRRDLRADRETCPCRVRGPAQRRRADARGGRHEHDGRPLDLVPTGFDELDESLCRALVHRGWWLTGAALARYHPHRIPDPGAITAPPT